MRLSGFFLGLLCNLHALPGDDKGLVCGSDVQEYGEASLWQGAGKAISEILLVERGHLGTPDRDPQICPAYWFAEGAAD